MKNVVTILLLFVYTSSITGFGVKKFYCCNKLQSISAILLVDKSAGNDKSSEDGGCCNTKYSFFKVKDNHKAASGIGAPLQPVADVLFDISHPPVYSCFYRDIPVAHRSNAPPPFESRPLYIVNCVYKV